MSRHFLCISLLLCFFAANLRAQTADDNIVITRCTESYTFTEKDGTPLVRNRKRTTYEATRMGCSLQPHVLYGENISLDLAEVWGAKAQHKSVTPENVFFDDTKVCFFDINLDRKGKKTEAEFRRTFRDLRYFTVVYLNEDYFIREKTLTFTIPKNLSRFHLIERNFTPNIHCERSVNGDGDSVFTYSIINLPAAKEEAQMPAASRVYPHILITGFFRDYKDMYAWSHELAGVDRSVPGLDALLADITRGCSTEQEKIAATYAWVQQNIRYIAFEAGIQGHRPDTPAEVLRKRYGDCKGMALLLRTLLQAQGFDARLVDIATTDIPYKMTETPTLAAVNHMICALTHQGRTYYLDATCEHIPIDFIPGSIQGCEAIIEDGEQCRVQTVPTLPAAASTDSLCFACNLQSLRGEWQLTGTVTRTWSGDMKEFFSIRLQEIDKSRQREFLSRALTGSNHNGRVEGITWAQNGPSAPSAILTGTVTNSSAVQAADDELYIDLNLNGSVFDQAIDTTKRIHDFLLPLRCRVVRQTEVELPAGYTLSYLSEGIDIATPQGVLQCTFRQVGNKVRFRKVMQLDHRLIPRGEMAEWNARLRRWADACNEQIILKKQ